jgi:hypothetical protein
MPPEDVEFNFIDAPSDLHGVMAVTVQDKGEQRFVAVGRRRKHSTDACPQPVP